MKSTHSDRLEKFLGTENVAYISRNMANWYGPPIAVAGVPGRVFATGDGDFIGECELGAHAHFLDLAESAKRRIARAARIASQRNRTQLNAGFASLSDLLTEATSEHKKQNPPFSYSQTLATNFAASWGWGANAAPAAPGGRATARGNGPTVFQQNAASGDTLHVVGASVLCSRPGVPTLLYDRIFDVAKTMNSTTAEAVTGVPTRYQSATLGAADYAGGNFMFPEVTTVLAATAHNWTVVQYTDQDGNTAQNAISVAGASGTTAGNVDITGAGIWFIPLAAGDTGVKALTQMQCSAAVATGAVNFVIGHPLTWYPAPAANLVARLNYFTTAFNMVRVFDDASLQMLCPVAPSGGTTTLGGQLTLLSG